LTVTIGKFFYCTDDGWECPFFIRHIYNWRDFVRSWLLKM